MAEVYIPRQRQSPENYPAQERLVFVHPKDPEQREFEVAREQLRADSIEANRGAVDDAYAQLEADRQAAVTRQAEQLATNEQLTEGIMFHGQAVKTTRDYAEEYGLAA